MKAFAVAALRTCIVIGVACAVALLSACARDVHAPVVDNDRGTPRPFLAVGPASAAATPVAVAAPAPLPPVDVWAVVVGLGSYADPEVGNLGFADKDARDMAAALVSAGWPKSQVLLLVDDKATKKNIEIALEAWLTKAKPNDLILLYWSGHGQTDPQDGDKIYFVCHDTNPRIPATGYRMDRVRDSLEERGVRNVVVLADTCHSGKLITRGNDRNLAQLISASLGAGVAAPAGWIFMVGADTDRVAIEHSAWSNGAFTYVALQGLRGAADGFESAGAADGVVTAGELRQYMQSRMPEETHAVLGTALHPVITTTVGNPDIWTLPLAWNAGGN